MMKNFFIYLFVTVAFAFQVNAQIQWTKDTGNPIFSRGESGSWDSQLALNPAVIYDGSIYQMWYSGYDGGHGAQTGYAYSSDGISWTRHPDPVLSWGTSGSWDDVTAFQPCVIYEDTIYKMWYCGHDGNLDHRQIGYATGSDSIHWSKYSSNPVLTPGPSGSWDDLYVESPEVKFIDGVYHMWYSGGNGTYSQIGHATSPDGIIWEKDSLNPVLEVGNPGSWDDVTVVQPSVVFDGNIYNMWYSGGVTSSWDWKTGYAYSMDGINWIKVSVNNPVMGLGDPGSWDDTFVGLCSVIYNDAESEFKMWYGGGNGFVVGDIGFATAPLDTNATGVENENSNVVLTEFSLFQNYPNPFNPATTINYQLPQTGFVTLKIYDILGREVATLVNEQKTMGRYSVIFDASRLVSGSYIYQLRVNEYVSSRKMILLK